MDLKKIHNTYKIFIFSVISSLIYTFFMNYQYYNMIFGYSNVLVIKSVVISFLQACLMFSVISLLGKIRKFIIWILFITSAIVAYYSFTYGYIQNKEMFALLWATNIHEARGVFSPTLVIYTVLGCASAWIMCRIMPKSKINLYNIALIFVVAISLLCTERTLNIRTEMKGCHPMPFGYLSHFGHSVKQQFRLKKMIETRTELSIPTPPENKEPLLIVLALGESLRADHLGMLGYERNTTPLAGRLPFISCKEFYSAASGTSDSVTRMLTRATVADPGRALTEKSIISVFRKAGFRTVWLTNQGSMANGETVVSSISKESEVYRVHPSVYDVSRKIKDEDLLPMLDEELRLSEGKNTLIILHSFGSHINPEDRYGDIFRKFEPVCGTFSISDCSEGELVNSYDNSVIATDAYWKQIYDKLRNRRAVLMITADHGDRLHGKFKGHNPRIMDNPALRWVPFMIWSSEQLENDAEWKTKYDNARLMMSKPLSHDYLFHSLLGASGISTIDYKSSLDIFNKLCVPYKDPFVQIPGIKETNQL